MDRFTSAVWLDAFANDEETLAEGRCNSSLHSTHDGDDESIEDQCEPTSSGCRAEESHDDEPREEPDEVHISCSPDYEPFLLAERDEVSASVPTKVSDLVVESSVEDVERRHP